jgi:Transcription termination factor nusG
VEVRHAQKHATERKFFPGYVLAKVELTDEAYHLIKNTPKVIGFLGSHKKPMPISDAEATYVLRQIQEGIERPKPFHAREQPSFNLILVEQLPQPFLNAGRSVFAQEFEHQAVERLHANLKRLVAHPQHVALNALHVVHYASLTKPGHATIKPVLRICPEAAAAEVAIGPISGIVDDGLPSFADRRKICDDAISR